MYKRIVFFLLLHFFFTAEIKAEDNYLDSLKKVIAGTSHDTIRLTAMVELTCACSEEDILKYSEPASALAQKLMESSEAKIKRFGTHAFAEVCNSMAYAYMNQGDIASAMSFNKKSLALRIKLDDKKGIGASYVNIGYILEHKGDIPSALEHYHKSLPYYEAANDLKGQAFALNNIGFVYQKQDDLSKALEYYKKSMKIRENIGDKRGISQSLTNIGSIFKLQKNYEEALATHLKSLAIQNELNDQSGISNSFNNIGFIYEQQNDPGLALEYYKKALEIREQIKEKRGIANSLNNIGRIYFRKNDLGKAVEAGKRSFQLANELGYPENIANASELLAGIYKRQGNYNGALEMYELYLRMHDSISNESTKKNALRQQLNYEYGKRAIADSVKYAESQKVKDAQIVAQQSQIENEKLKRWLMFGGLFLVVVFAGFIFNRFKVSQKQNAIIEAQKRDVEDQKEIIELQKMIVEEKQKNLTDSIQYAQKIQNSLLPTEIYIERNMKRLNKG